MTTDVLALREALLEAKTFIEAVEWEDSHTVDKVQDWMGRAEAALAAVRKHDAKPEGTPRWERPVCPGSGKPGTPVERAVAR